MSTVGVDRTGDTTNGPIVLEPGHEFYFAADGVVITFIAIAPATVMFQAGTRMGFDSVEDALSNVHLDFKSDEDAQRWEMLSALMNYTAGPEIHDRWKALVTSLRVRGEITAEQYQAHVGQL